jgi:hypothetical protein
MDYQTLPEKIQEVLSYTSLLLEEKEVLMHTYLHPGVSRTTLESSIVGAAKILNNLIDRRLLFQQQSEYSLYPIPLVLLLRDCAENSTHRGLRDLPVLRSIDQWLKYPLMRSPDVTLKTTNDRGTLIRWLFDLHAMSWDRVYCFGDYESFIETIGYDTEKEWIHERIKRQRNASVIATKDGQWAQQIQRLSQQELRDCLIEPRDFSDLFIMAFPDIHTTVMGSSDKEITFVHSDTIANLYTGMVEKSLIKS